MESTNRLAEAVLKERLCSGCGTCGGVCPQECIYYGEEGIVDEIDWDKCINCDLCYRCCPSVDVSFKLKEDAEFKYDSEIGEYISFFRGHACNAELRKNGASGGMATGFLSYLLDEKIVDRVICADFAGESATYRIISKAEELRAHQKSYYIPIPLNLAIREIKRKKLKYAVTGTPCQLQGLTKAEKILPQLKDKIIVKVGLFCGYIQQKKSIEDLARYMSCEGEEWKFKGWRCGEYPGYATFQNVETKEEKSMNIYDVYNLVIPFYTLPKCFVCPDGTNEYSDISLGDIHAEGTDENIGIFRTAVGKQLAMQAMERGYLVFTEEKEEYGILYRMIKGVAASKRRVVLEQIQERKRKGKKVPEYYNLSITDKVNPIIRYFMRKKAKMFALSSDSKNHSPIKTMKWQMKRGKYIYNYPESSWIYRMICRLRSVMR